MTTSIGTRATLAALALGAAAALGAFGPAAAASREGREAGTFAPPAALLTGEYWSGLTPAERQIYLSGFLAGAAAEQARGVAVAAGRGGDSAAVSSGAVAALRDTRALHFPFAPSVYSAQVDDFYWWSNHRETPIVDAMIFFNGEMLKQREEARP